MDFAFSEEQEMLRQGARSLMNDKYGPDRIVELTESEEGWDASSWKQFAELGWTGLSIPEEQGGAGMSFLDEAVVIEELARAIYPGPYFSTVALALPALKSSPELITRIASGDAAATLAWAEPDGPRFLEDLGGAGTKATSSGDAWSLTGEKYLVPDLGAASIVVVVARSPEGLGFWALRDGDGVAASVKTTVDSTRRLGTLSLNDASATLLVEPGKAGEVIDRIRRRAYSAVALEAAGIAARVLELSTEYTKERQQFGKPIGSYQAVSHQVSDMYMQTELTRSLAYWAAWCVATDDPQAPNAAAAAKAFAAEAAVTACESAIQVHGGIGFTWEHVLHRYYRRAQWLDAFEGGPTRQRKEIASTLLG